MPIHIDLQNDDECEAVPAAALFQRWVDAALQSGEQRFEQSICIVDREQGRDLNRRYRGKDYATNVLAFPADSSMLDYDCLGDLVICAPVVLAEAAEQAKAVEAHWAHLVIHGMLHLQGYDHETEEQAEVMESREVEILDSLGYTNPYND